jgi:hypothetical protein
MVPKLHILVMPGGLGITMLMEDETILQWLWKVEKGYEYRGHGSCFLVSFDFNTLTS